MKYLLIICVSVLAVGLINYYIRRFLNKKESHPLSENTKYSMQM